MSTQTLFTMSMSYAMMCKYYELCMPGVETKNPHFLSSLHLIKRESSPAVESVSAKNVSPLPHPPQENKVTSTTGRSQLKLLFKGKKDNKIHVKCSCNDITDGSAIKRKFLIKCNKCQAMVHGKCHNLNAQLFNNSNNHSSKWFCSMCTIGIQSEIRKNAMMDDLKRVMQTSPKSKPSASKSVKNKSRKKDSANNKNKSNKSSTTNSKSKHKGLKSNDNNEKPEKKAKKDKSKNSKDTKRNSSKKTGTSTQRGVSGDKNVACKRPRFVPIQPKQS